MLDHALSTGRTTYKHMYAYIVHGIGYGGAKTNIRHKHHTHSQWTHVQYIISRQDGKLVRMYVTCLCTIYA